MIWLKAIMTAVTLFGVIPAAAIFALGCHAISTGEDLS